MRRIADAVLSLRQDQPRITCQSATDHFSKGGPPMASLFASAATLTLPCSLSRLLAANLLLALDYTLNAQSATAHSNGAQNTIPTGQPSYSGGGIGHAMTG